MILSDSLSRMLSLGLCIFPSIASGHIHYGFQSGSSSSGGSDMASRSVDDHSFASSLHFDSVNNLLFVTGGTYSRYWDAAAAAGSKYADSNSHLEHSDCFMSVFKVPKQPSTENDDEEIEQNMQIVYARRFGVEGVPETCSAVAYMPAPGTKAKAITIGHTTEGGLLTSLRSPGSRHSSVYGVMLDLDMDIYSNHGVTSTVTGTIGGGMLIHDLPVQYPIAVTSDPLSTTAKEIFVVSLASISVQENESSHHDDHTDRSAGGGFGADPDHEEPPYGTDFRIVVQMMEPKSQELIDYEESQLMDDDEIDEGGVKETISAGWKRSFSPRLSSLAPTDTELASIHISDLVYIPATKAEDVGVENDDVLLLTGTTDGFGQNFGGVNEADGYSKDGFVTKLNPRDGTTDLSNGLDSSTKRVGTKTSQDYIRGLCYQQGSSTNVEYVYVVGYTDGWLDMSLNESQLTKRKPAGTSPGNAYHAFLTMLRLDTLEVVWTRQFGSNNGNPIYGYSCSVTADGGTVYMGGTVTSGDSIKSYIGSNNPGGDQQSKGGDDVFIVSLNAGDGSTKFVKQTGTSDDDSLARANGVVTDRSGGAIIAGNTRGSLMRWRGEDGYTGSYHDPSDVFIMSVEKDTGKAREISEVTQSNIDDEVRVEFDDDDEVDDTIDIGDDGVPLYGVEIAAICIASVIFFAIFLYVGKKYTNQRNANKWDNNDRVMEYLEDFNDEDVDLHIRYSATGGFHGIYDFEANKKNGANGAKFAGQGTVGYEEMREKELRRSHPPDVKTENLLEDVLFDESGAKEDKFDDEEGASESYKGVVDSYDASWKARSQHSLPAETTPPSETFHSLPPVESIAPSRKAPVVKSSEPTFVVKGDGEGHSLPASGDAIKIDSAALTTVDTQADSQFQLVDSQPLAPSKSEVEDDGSWDKNLI